jgi:hypothetical protein
LWQPQLAERIVRQLPVIVDQIGLQNQRELPVDFPNRPTQTALLSLAPEIIYRKESLIDRWLSSYESFKDTGHSNLSHFVFSRLENSLYLGIKIQPDTFVGIVSHRGLSLEKMAPLTLAFFKNAGSLIDFLPKSQSGPAQELVQYIRSLDGMFVFNHDQINSPLFKDWYSAHPEARRIFYNSLAEIWQLKN